MRSAPTGRTLAVGAVDETSLTRGIDGDENSKQDNTVSAGAIYVLRADRRWLARQAYVKSFNIGPTDLFGMRLALSRDGSVLAAGAPGQSGGGRGFKANPQDFTAPESGAVYVFLRSAGRWTQHAYIKAPNAEAFDQFGSGVALSADGATMAVAANGEDSGSGIDGNQNDNSLRDSGAVFVFLTAYRHAGPSPSAPRAGNRSSLRFPTDAAAELRKLLTDVDAPPGRCNISPSPGTRMGWRADSISDRPTKRGNRGELVYQHERARAAHVLGVFHRMGAGRDGRPALCGGHAHAHSCMGACRRRKRAR